MAQALAETLADRMADLASPHHIEGRIGAKVQSRSRDKRNGLMVAFIDARTVATALDAAIGAENWRTELVERPTPVIGPNRDGVQSLLGFSCRVRLALAGPGAEDDAPEWMEVSREDVGWNSHTSDDPGTSIKGSVSDGLKRAAAQFGLGRPLYELPQEWVALNDRGYPADDGEVADVIARWNAILRGEAVEPRQRPQGGSSGGGGGGGRPAGSGGGGGRGGATLTGKQKGLIEKLSREKEGADGMIVSAVEAAGKDSLDQLSVGEASGLIESLMGLPAAGGGGGGGGWAGSTMGSGGGGWDSGDPGSDAPPW